MTLNKNKRLASPNNFSLSMCGDNSYDINKLSQSYDFLANLHIMAQQIIKRYQGKGRIKTFIYGANIPGRLTAMVFEEYTKFEIKGFFDQHKDYLSFANHDLGVFAPSRLPIYEVESPHINIKEIDIIVCAIAPLHYPTIHTVIRQHLPHTPIYFTHKAHDIPSISPSPPKEPIFVATTGRCGTHWFRSILLFLLRKHGYTEIDTSIKDGEQKREVPHHIYKNLESSTYVVDHFKLTNGLKKQIQQHKLKAIFLYRDPRDIQVSASFYKDTAFSFDYQDIIAKSNQILEWQDIEQALLVRYEDLKINPDKTIKKIVQFLNIDVDQKAINNIINATSFEYLSGGRHPGETDSSHHYRKGIIGDWKNHYTKENIKKIKTLCGQKLIQIGYEKDLNW